MWKHFPTGAEATAPEACFALVSGLLTGLRTPFSGRIQIVGKHLGFVYRMFAKLGIKIESPQPAMRQLWADRGTTAAVALSIENGDAPLKNWTGVGARDFPLSKKGWKLDGAEVDKMITRKLSCGDCPAPCKGIVGVKSRGLSDVRRPDYPRFTSLMGVTYISDPTPGRHTAGSASWNETFGAGFPLPEAAPKDEVQIAWSLTGGLPWVDMVNALTGWEVDQKELLLCGERIQNLRNAFNVREGIRPADFQAHPRMKGEGDGPLEAGPLAGVRAPLEQLKRDYYQAMDWDPGTGRLSRNRAEQLGMAELLDAQLA